MSEREREKENKYCLTLVMKGKIESKFFSGNAILKKVSSQQSNLSFGIICDIVLLKDSTSFQSACKNEYQL